MRQKFNFRLFAMLMVISCQLSAQNDLDAIRYSRGGTGGTSRYIGMGGAFGAVGADLSVAATNPGALGLFRKGEISFSGGMLLTGNEATLYNKPTVVRDVKFVFNNFGLAGSWKVKRDPDSRHLISFVNTQLQNFFSATRMSGYTRNSSIARDMLDIANANGDAGNLNWSYEGLGFDTYLLDTIDGKFISMLDTKRTVRQTRDLVTSGKMNDLNFSYAYAHKDRYYIGASLGIPQVDYISTTTHSEWDDNDSIRLKFTQDGYEHTFIDGMPAVHDYYRDLGAFHHLVYEEYFKTTGSGFNVKLGGVARLNDMLRLGLYYHTPTIFILSDTYINEMTVGFDQKPSDPEFLGYPEDGGTFRYRVITPSRLGLNAAIVLEKKAVIGIDYELVNYRKAQLGSDNLSDFEAANSDILSKYNMGHNLRVGAEYNLNPLMLRAGYSMNGSPFGKVFSGSFVRNSVSAGFGLRMKNNFYIDFAWVQTMSREDYFLFSSLSTEARVNYNSSLISATAGIKF